jgi:hypothetical protein
MQAHAPLVPAQHAQKQRRLYEMVPGMFFRVAPDSGMQLPAAAHRGMIALMHHRHATVSDNARIWCVIIAAEPSDGIAGEFFALPRDTPVQRLHLVDRIQLATEQ